MTRETLAERVAARRRERTGEVEETAESEQETPALRRGEYLLEGRKAKFEQVLAKDDYPRMGLIYAWLVDHDGAPALVGTDQFKMGVLPLVGEAPEKPVAIDKDAVKALCAAGGFIVAKNGAITVEDDKGKQHFDPPKNPGDVFKWRELIASHVEAQVEEPLAVMRFNAKYLRQLADAVGAMGTQNDAVEVECYGVLKPMVLRPLDDTTGRFGLLSPIRPNPTKENNDDDSDTDT